MTRSFNGFMRTIIRENNCYEVGLLKGCMRQKETWVARLCDMHTKRRYIRSRRGLIIVPLSCKNGPSTFLSDYLTTIKNRRNQFLSKQTYCGIRSELSRLYWMVWVTMDAVRESTSRSILIYPLDFLVLEKKVFLPSFLFFRVYENDVLFSSFYSLYL